MLRIIVLALLCAACQKEPDSEPTEDVHLPYSFDQVAERMLAMSEPSGWLVNTYDGGGYRKAGDSLIFSGVALGALDCRRGDVVEAALVAMLEEKDGDIYRHPSLKDEPASLDGELGLLWGVSQRVARCPETQSVWAPLIERHAAHAWRYLAGLWDPVLWQVEAQLGLRALPTETERGEIGTLAAGWAFAVVQTHEAAFRLHLGYLALSIVDAPKGKASYCAAVKAAQIPLLEHFCGRSGLGAWAAAFQFNAWEYRFQRAAWETPDGKPGMNTPALDYLLAVHLLEP